MANTLKGRANACPLPSLSRRDTAPHIKNLIQKFYARKNFSSHVEVGVTKWGKFKADIVLINMKRQFIIVEVKSCWQDFNTDDQKGKWRNYLPMCDKFYLAFTSEVWDKVKDRVTESIAGSGAGVIIVPEHARSYRAVSVIKPARTQGNLDDDTRLWLLTKLACKAGSWN